MIGQKTKDKNKKTKGKDKRQHTNQNQNIEYKTYKRKNIIHVENHKGRITNEKSQIATANDYRHKQSMAFLIVSPRQLALP